MPDEILHTEAADEIFKRVFVFLGFCSVLLPLLISVSLLIPRTRKTLEVAVLLAGIGVGAAIMMIILSRNDWALVI